MWLVVRLALAVIGLVVRWWRRPVAREPAGALDGTPYFQRVRRAKRGAPVGFDLAMRLDAPVWMSLRREGGLHRWAKRLRLAREHQTGDPTFDDAVFVATDHPTAWAMLSREAAARRAVLEALAAGFARIHTDGTHLWMTRPALAEPSDDDLGHLRAVHAAFAPLEYELPSRLRDGFGWKAFVVECVVWSIAGYAIAVLLENSVTITPAHVFRHRLLVPGLLLCAGLLLALLVGTSWLLRRSPRGVAIILEAGVVLLAALPIATVQTFADLNRAWDPSPPVRVDVPVEACSETRKRRNRRSYHVQLAPTPSQVTPPGARVELPAEIRLARELCDAAAAAGRISLTLRAGRFGHPWYQQIAVGELVWTP
jgi:hypothetical protein